MLVLAVSILIFGTVILSNTYIAREQARQQSCAYNLTGWGTAIRDYAFHQPNQVAPEIAAQGRLSFAGIYAPRLKDRGLLTSENSLWCPSNLRNPLLQLGLLLIRSHRFAN